jgi:NAD(P)-dependent dehydrogenase (short-subunit alcohol dehydrogenase family)
MGSLDSKVAIITGGNSGIGFATAELFVAEGAQVIIVGRRAEAIDAACEALGGAVVGMVGDVADPETHHRVADLVHRRFGSADIYVANAGTNVIAPTPAVTLADYDAQFAANTRAVFLGVQAIVPRLNDGASVILMSSAATAKVMDGHAAYAGAKAAIETFARSWALEFKDRRIRVNVLSPGPVKTPILTKLGISEEALPGFEAQVAAAIPLGRLGRPDELAQAALFLASETSSFVAGVNLRADGGIALT